MKLKCIYIDSNPVDRLQFLQILKHFPEIILDAEFSNALNAKEYLNYNSIDFAIVASDLPFAMFLNLWSSLKTILKSSYLPKLQWMPLNLMKRDI